MLEKTYQRYLIKRLTVLFPGCIILKNDAEYMPGIPDLLILFRDRWAMLEVKTYSEARTQPNQEYYIDKVNDMSFGAFIYPENEEDVLRGLQRTFESRRSTRISKRQQIPLD